MSWRGTQKRYRPVYPLARTSFAVPSLLVKFAVDHDFDGTVAAVAGALTDPAFHTSVDLPDVSRPEVVESTTDGARRTLVLRYEFVGSLDPIVHKLLAGRKLTWLQTLTIDTQTGNGTLTFAFEGDAKRLSGEANIALTATTPNRTHQHTDGELRVRVPVLGGSAEKRIVPGIVARLDVEADALQRWLNR
jgi:hypothetical protein